MENVQLKDILKKITHKYLIAMAQTFKCVEDAHKPMNQKLEELEKLVENNEEYKSSTESALNKIQKAFADIDKLKSTKGETGGEIVFKSKEDAILEKNIQESSNEDEYIPISEVDEIDRNNFQKIKEGHSLIVDMTERESKITSYIFETFLFPERIKNLLRMTIVYLFSLFEAFLKDFFIELLVIKTELMKNKGKTIDFDKITEFKSMKDLHYYLASQIVNELGYRNIDEIRQFLEKKFKILLKINFPLWEEVRESYYRRNIIVHNSGKVSEIYIGKMNLNQSELGKELPIDFDYVKKCFHSLHKLCSFIENKIIQNIKLD